jgi:hypothetical protein
MRHNVVGSMRASMGDDFLRRVRKTSLILGAVSAIVFAFYFGLMPSVAWTTGLLWSLLNLSTIRSIVRRLVTEERDAAAIVTAVALKFPLLYAAAVVMLLVLKLPPAWWMAGFTWPLFVIVMKSAGRVYLHLDETA